MRTDTENTHAIRKLSFTSIQSALQCKRRFYYSYIDPLPTPDDNTLPKLIGSLYHKGMEAWIKTQDAAQARKAVKDGMNEFLTADAMLVDQAANVAMSMLSHYTSQLPIGEGKRYLPVTFGQLRDRGIDGKPFDIGEHNPDDIVTEWYVEHEIDGITYVGYVDTVLLDTYNDGLVIVDWKTKARFSSADVAAMDSQLDLYALLLRRMGLNVNQTIMWQFRSAPPNPARLNKDLTPSVASQNTTWSVWLSTLPPHVNPEHYRSQLADKLKDWDYFIMPIESMIHDATERELGATLDQALTEVQRIYAGETAGVYNTYACRDCRFSKICAGLRNGVPLENLKSVLYEVEETDDF